MNIRKRKTRLSNNRENSFSDTDANYTIDEDVESQNPFVGRPRIGRSPQSLTTDSVSTKTRSKVNETINSDLNPKITTDNIMSHTQQEGAVGPAVGTVNLGGLEAMLERVMTMNHNSFLGEIQDLKKTLVDTINKNNNEGPNGNLSGLSHASPSFHNMPSNRQNSFRTVNQNNSDVTTNCSNSIRIDKWNISYDGSQNVQDFLFEVETLQKRYNYSLEQVVASFHLFLKGRAENWFWRYLKQNPNTTYDQLKESIMKEFARIENDCDKIVKMVERRQMPKESFDEFFTELLTMNTR